MYNFRYYAIGHSYLKHGPFVGWQTDGFWGMAASAPENDYFHKVQEGLKSEFDCKVEAIGENHAPFERLCTEDATEEKYTESKEYAHMRDVLLGFKPNLITMLIGGGNTPARDAVSLTRFFEVLYGLVAKYKLPEAVVVCPTTNQYIYSLAKPVADKYGFIVADVSFIHAVKGRENPYYAFAEYPEYDARLANGAVEFRTHPNNKGHAAIADTIVSSGRESLAKIPEGDFDGEYFYEKFINVDVPERFKIKTSPEMNISFFGFNVRQRGESVTFGSAPGTGATLAADSFTVPADSKTFYAELKVDGTKDIDSLKVRFFGTNCEAEVDLPVSADMQIREISVPAVCGEIKSLRISTGDRECVVTVKGIGFK